MPELPEVETMVRSLRPAMEGRAVRTLRIRDPLLLDRCGKTEVEESARGASVLSVARRGKWVVFDLGAVGGCIVIQPRMTGGFWLVPPPRPERARVVFELEGRDLPVWFCDTRRLGKLSRYSDTVAAEAAFARAHGPDALLVTLDQLVATLRRTARPIKATLMDQKVVAGIGNIYADEILYEARVHPQAVANRLRRDAVARVQAAIVSVLRRAIEAEGSSFDDGYRTVTGQAGGFLEQNAVYGRTGLPCRSCQATIQRMRFPGLSSRSTHFCPNCQRILGRSGRTGGNRLD